MGGSLRTVLGFDYGTKQIGAALLQAPLDFATPLCVHRSRDGKPDWVALEALIKEWRPQICVVGLALNMDGTSSDLAERCLRFSRQLEGRFAHEYNFSVEMQDERLSSVEAKELIAELHGNVDYRKVPADSLAAKIILERWQTKA
ncbi:MAG: Holliday junction resolvase RuvX [Pseudomonadales bacterium]